MSEPLAADANAPDVQSVAVAFPHSPRQPQYPWGLQVQALVDLHNDGSYPKADDGAMLVAAGAVGEIVRIGHHAEADMPIYVVDFGQHVLGCMEDEIAPAQTAEPA
jgi:nitrogen fixation protein NifZ